MFDLLPSRFVNALKSLDFTKLNELRLRVDSPTIINYDGWCYLGEQGITSGTDFLKPTFDELQEIVYRACECSVYAHNDQIKNGFVTYKGQRIGLCGEVVTEGQDIVTIKNFSSLVIRIPHEKEDCSLSALDYLVCDGIFLSTMIVAPPACGKTTFIRDLVWQLTSKHIVKNVLVIDERGEIGAVENGIPTLKLGDNVDVFSGVSKRSGVTIGIRSLAPTMVVLDEIMTLDDCFALRFAVGCGVTILATIHAKNVNDLKKKIVYTDVEKVFERVVVLSDRCGIGTIESVETIKGERLFDRGEK